MTREEKTNAIREKCRTMACSKCPLKDYMDCGFSDYTDDEINSAYELMFDIVESAPPTTTIKDSGERRQFDTGCVRDIADGKGRCDLLPLDVIADLIDYYGEEDYVLSNVSLYIYSGDKEHIHDAIVYFQDHIGWSTATMLLEVSKHYEDGARKYDERNWEKGMPLHCYIDSGVRHYIKYLRGDKDEPHDRAFVWNMLGALWTQKHKPELIDLPFVQNNNGEER